MAENIQWILEQEGSHAKMVVWAHNGHVAASPRWMGAHLREMFGGAMAVFGFAFNRGSFQAMDEAYPSRGLRSFHVGPAPANSLDRALARADLRIAVIDLHAVPKYGPVAAWFDTPRVSRSIGSGYNEAAPSGIFSNEVATKVYDAVLFVERTSAARALQAGVRSAPQRLSAPANLDFEKPGSGPLPANWEAARYLKAFDFDVGVSTENPRNGRQCAVISRPPGRHYGEMFGSLRQTLSAAAYTGKRIKLRASVRTDLDGPGNQAYLWLRVMNKGMPPAAVAFYDGMADRPIVSREWRDHEIVADVPASAESIEYGLALVGEGRAWLDAVSLELIPE
jgi:erythromycin esterase